MLSSLWRIELLHPLVVHFAVAILVLGALSSPARWLDKDSQWHFLRPASQALIVLGIGFGWLAILTGDWAYSEIAGTLCVPNAADYHQQYAYTAMWLFTGGFIADVIHYWFDILKEHSGKFSVCLIAVYFAGAGCLFIAGEYGAHMVYEQAAGVNSPGAECRRFSGTT